MSSSATSETLSAKSSQGRPLNLFGLRRSFWTWASVIKHQMALFGSIIEIQRKDIFIHLKMHGYENKNAHIYSDLSLPIMQVKKCILHFVQNINEHVWRECTSTNVHVPRRKIRRSRNLMINLILTCTAINRVCSYAFLISIYTKNVKCWISSIRN